MQIPDKLTCLVTTNKIGCDLASQTNSNKLPKYLNLSNTKCNKSELEQLKTLICKYHKCFSSHSKSPDPALGVTHSIETGVARPVNCAPYKASPAQRIAIENQINEMLTDNIIEPSKSPSVLPIVLVGKSDCSIRFCVDYRKLNSVTKKDVYPLPRIDDCLNALGGCKYYSTFDLASGYWQILANINGQGENCLHQSLWPLSFQCYEFRLNECPGNIPKVYGSMFFRFKMAESISIPRRYNCVLVEFCRTHKGFRRSLQKDT